MTTPMDRDAVLERWVDIRDDPKAIARCGDRWEAVASIIGCKLHGFNDGSRASFATPDGNIIEIGPKFRAAISGLSTPPSTVAGEREMLVEALREAHKIADDHAKEWGDRWKAEYKNKPRTGYDNGRLAGLSDGAAVVARKILAHIDVVLNPKEGRG